MGGAYVACRETNVVFQSEYCELRKLRTPNCFDINSTLSENEEAGFESSDAKWNCKVWKMSGFARVSMGLGLLSLAPTIQETAKAVKYFRGFLASHDAIEPVLVSRRADGFVRVKTNSLKLFRVLVKKDQRR